MTKPYRYLEGQRGNVYRALLRHYKPISKDSVLRETTVSAKMLADELSMNPKAVLRALRELRTLGIINPTGKAGRTTRYAVVERSYRSLADRRAESDRAKACSAGEPTPEQPAR